MEVERKLDRSTRGMGDPHDRLHGLSVLDLECLRSEREVRALRFHRAVVAQLEQAKP